MTTNRIPSDYYTSDEFIYRNNKIRTIPHENYSHVLSNNTGVITNKTKNGSYNIVEKDFGDYKVIYHIPIEYGDDYDISQLEDIPIVPEQQSNDSPRLVRRRIYQQYNDVDYDNDYEYVEEIPVVSPRRRVYVSPRRQEDREVVQRIYEQRPPPTQTVEYIYEDDHSDPYAHRQENEEVEYIVRERVPKQIYMEEPRPARRTVYVEDPSVPPSSPPPPPLPPHSLHSPHRSPSQPSPRQIFNPKTSSPISTKPVRRSYMSPPASTRRQQQQQQQQPTRSTPVYESPVRPNIPKTNEPPLRLMDVIAQNRAKRGSRIPKPRREVDEEKLYDPPTYKRNIIKNGFIIHK